MSVLDIRIARCNSSREFGRSLTNVCAYHLILDRTAYVNDTAADAGSQTAHMRSNDLPAGSIRNPSCLISCSPCLPEGGIAAPLARHGLIEARAGSARGIGHQVRAGAKYITRKLSARCQPRDRRSIRNSPRQCRLNRHQLPCQGARKGRYLSIESHEPSDDRGLSEPSEGGNRQYIGQYRQSGFD
jgi:hypothetical protein